MTRRAFGLAALLCCFGCDDDEASEGAVDAAPKVDVASADGGQTDVGVADMATRTDGPAADAMVPPTDGPRPGDGATDGPVAGDAAPIPDVAPPDAAEGDVRPAPDGAVECDDEDGDGYGDGLDCRDEDCDDADPEIHPGADEVPYNGVDEDCSGTDLTDVDEDGFAAEQIGGDDCDDGNAMINPGMEEIPGDGADQNCDGSDEIANDGDGDADGHRAIAVGGDDCNDANPAVHPGAEEVPYDGIDQDCEDGDLDDFDEDGHASVAVEGGDDCDDLDPNVNPEQQEVGYNGVDDDCDADTSDDDLDGDGHASVAVEGGDDCDDMNGDAHPGNEEIPYNGINDDCDDMTRDDDLDGDGVPNERDCADDDPERSPDLDEVPADEIDNDCDGLIDEPPGAPCPGHDDMVTLDGGGCIDKYEASRPDATANDPGEQGGAARSVTGVLPWTGVNYEAARDACVAAGKILCLPEQWFAGCNRQGVAYPYGAVYAADACNGADAGRAALAPTGSHVGCASPSGALDMSGNAAEWVDGVNEQLGDVQVNGGHYESVARDLECGVASFALPNDARATLGFRCCIR